MLAYIEILLSLTTGAIVIVLSIDMVSRVEIMPKDQQMWMQFAGTALGS